MSEKKADSLLETLLALGRVGLMIVGIIGIAVEAFKEKGLISQLLSKATSSTFSVIISLAIVVLLLIINRWISTSDGNQNKKGDLPMYLMMGVGAYFIFRFLTESTLG